MTVNNDCYIAMRTGKAMEEREKYWREQEKKYEVPAFAIVGSIVLCGIIILIAMMVGAS